MCVCALAVCARRIRAPQVTPSSTVTGRRLLTSEGLDSAVGGVDPSEMLSAAQTAELTYIVAVALLGQTRIGHCSAVIARMRGGAAYTSLTARLIDSEARGEWRAA